MSHGTWGLENTTSQKPTFILKPGTSTGNALQVIWFVPSIKIWGQSEKYIVDMSGYSNTSSAHLDPNTLQWSQVLEPTLLSERAGFSHILWNVADSGRSVSHRALYQSDAQVGSTLQGDRRAVWSVNDGYGVLQGAHWAYSAGNRLLRQWLPWF